MIIFDEHIKLKTITMEITDYNKVEGYLLELGYTIVHQDAESEVFVVEKQEEGVTNLFIGVANPILIIEQFLFSLKDGSSDIYKSLLIKNRDIIHGAFVLDEDGNNVIFRDTLQIDNLDLNELEGTLNSLILLLNEYSEELISYSKA